jgi:hypothetical protein
VFDAGRVRGQVGELIHGAVALAELSGKAARRLERGQIHALPLALLLALRLGRGTQSREGALIGRGRCHRSRRLNMKMCADASLRSCMPGMCPERGTLLHMRARKETPFTQAISARARRACKPPSSSSSASTSSAQSPLTNEGFVTPHAGAAILTAVKAAAKRAIPVDRCERRASREVARITFALLPICHDNSVRDSALRFEFRPWTDQ